MRNRYVFRSRISEYLFRRFLRHVAADLTGVQIAALTGLNRNTVNRLLACLRVRMAQACEASSPLRGTVEVDECYFGPRRIRGRPGRSRAPGKTAVFGILKRGGRVYTEPVPDCSRARLQRVIRGRVTLDSVVHSDGWSAYDGLIDLGYRRHKRVDHRSGEFVQRRDRRNHINGIEGFWGYAKTRLARFRGVHPHTFYLHLKECEFRYNNRRGDLYKVLLKLCREHPLS